MLSRKLSKVKITVLIVPIMWTKGLNIKDMTLQWSANPQQSDLSIQD